MGDSKQGVSAENQEAAPDVTAELTAAQLLVVERLRGFQVESDNKEVEFRHELSSLKKKYDDEFAKYQEQRAKVIIKDATIGTSELPKFWLTAMENHQLMRDMIEDHDRKILEYLQNITSSWLGDLESDGFQLTFHFAPNPYFEQTVLTKKYKLAVDGRHSILESALGTKITWKEGKDVTKRSVTRTQRNKKTKQTRTVTHTEDNESFFNLFNSLFPPGEDASREDVEEYNVMIDTEYDVGIVLKEKIIPHAIGWFMAEERDPSHSYDDSEDETNSESDSYSSA